MIKTSSLRNRFTCTGTALDLGPWLDIRVNSAVSESYAVLSGTITEYNNGTALLVAQIQNNANTNIKFNINATLSGRTVSGTPHFNNEDFECVFAPGSDWYYYTQITGTFTGVAGSLVAGAIVSIYNGTDIQIGTGAYFSSQTNTGLSGWLDLVVTQQPSTGANISIGGNGTDFYFDVFNISTPTMNASFNCCGTALGNLITNPNFETNVSGWTATNGEVSQGTGGIYGNFLQVNVNDYGNNYNVYQDVTIGANQQFKFTGYAAKHGASPYAKIWLEFYNGTTLISQLEDFWVTLNYTGSSWQTITPMEGFTPAGTTKIRINGFANSTALKFDNLSLISCNPCPTTTICSGKSTTQTVSNCTGSIAWNTGATTASITVSPTTTTNYVATCTNTASQGSNLLTNGGFETNLTNWDNWGNTTNVTVTSTSGEFRSGTKGARVNASATSLGFASTWETIPVNPGTNYTLSAWAKTSNTSAFSAVQFLWRDYYGNQISNTLRKQITNTAFTQYSINSTAPQGAYFAEIQFWVNSSAYVYIDDVSFNTSATTQNNSTVFVVNVNPTPTATASSNSPVAVGGTINLSSSGGGTYAWVGPSGFTNSTQNPILTSATAAMGGVYTVTVTAANGCTATATTNVTVNSSACSSVFSGFLINDMVGSSDITLTNNGTYLISSLPASWNIETTETGTFGSVVFTVTGSTTATNTENTAAYNHPGTGTAATWGAGTYTIKASGYSGTAGTGILCDEETITIILSNTAYCAGNCISSNLVTNPQFETSVNGWHTTNNGVLTRGSGGTYGQFLELNVSDATGTFTAYQDVNFAANTQYQFTGYAAKHGVNNLVKMYLEFYNGSTFISKTADANITLNYSGAFQTVNFSGTTPANTTKIRIVGWTQNNALKFDNLSLTSCTFCLAATPSVSTICVGQTSVLTASNCSGTVSWSNGMTGTSITVSPTSTTTYTATCTTTSQGSNLIQNADFETNSLSPWNNWGGTSITSVSSERQNGTYGAKYSSTTDNGFGQDVPTTAGKSFTLTGWGKVSNSAASSSIGFQFYSSSWTNLGNFNTEINATASFQQYSVTNTAPANTAWIQVFGWSGSGSIMYLDNFSLVENITSTTTTSVTIAVNASPTASASSNSPITAGNTINLTSSGGGTYAWVGPSSFINSTQNPTRTSATAAMGGVYTVTVIAANGCTATATTNVIVNACSVTAPTATNGSRCGAGTVGLSASGCSGIYNWYAAATGGASLGTGANFTTPSITANTTYYVDCTVSGCVSSRAATLATVRTISITNVVTSACINQPLQDVATVNVTVAWTNAPSGDKIKVTIGNKIEYIDVAGGATSPQTITFIVPANGIANNPITASWITFQSGACAATSAYNSPTACSSDNLNCEKILYLCGPDKPADGDAYDHGFMNYLTAVGAGTGLAAYTKPDASGYGLYDPANINNIMSVNLNDYTMVIISPTTENAIAANLLTALKGYSGGILMMNFAQSDDLGLVVGNGYYNYQNTAYTNNTNQISIYNYDNINPSYNLVLTGGDYHPIGVGSLWYGLNNASTTNNGINFKYNASDALPGVPATHGKRVYLGFHMNGLYSNAQNGGAMPAPTSSYFNPAIHLTLEAKALFDQSLKNTATGITVTATGDTQCVGSTINLSASGIGIGSYSWTGPNGFTSNLQNPTRSNITAAMGGIYTITATSTTGCTATATANVIVNTIAAPTSAGASRCNAGTLTLTANGCAGTYNWYAALTGGASLSTTASYTTPSLATTTNYYVSCTVGSCTNITRTTVAVTINSIPTSVTAASNSPVAYGNAINLSATATGATTYAWSGPNNFTSNVQNPTIAVSSGVNVGTYILTAAGTGGCTATATTQVMVFSSEPGAVDCSNIPTLNFTSPSIISGSAGAVGTQYRFSNVLAGTDAIVTIQSKSHADIDILNIDSPASAYGGYDAAMQPIIDYNWINGGGSFDAAGDKSVTFKIDFVDAGTTTAKVVPLVTMTGVDIDGSGVTNEVREFIDASGHQSFEKQTTSTLTTSGNTKALGPITTYAGVNETILDIMASYFYPNVSSITVTYGANWGGATADFADNGLPNTDEARLNSLYFKCFNLNEITCNPVNPPTATGASRCGTGTVTLSANGCTNGTYNWYDALTGGASLGSNATFTTPSISATKIYYVDCTLAGCTSSPRTVATATINTIPTPTATGDTECIGSTISLSATGGTTYAWTGPSSFTSNISNPTRTSATAAMAGIYNVTITNAAGCSATATATVAITATSVGGTISPATQTICVGVGNIPTIHTVSGIVGNVVRWEYKTPGGAWTNWGGTSTTAPSTCCFYTVGTWQVRAFVQNGVCAEVASSVADVVVVAAPTVAISANNATVCTGGTATLTAVVGNGTGTCTAQWQSSPNGTTWTNIVGTNTYTTPALSSTTQYRATYACSGMNCVTATSNVVIVTVTNTPAAPTVVSGSRCGTGTVTLSATCATGTVQWNDFTNSVAVGTGNSFTTPSLTATTQYWAYCILNGCWTSPTLATATINAIPAAPTVTNGSRCGTGTVNLSASCSTGTVEWYVAAGTGAPLGAGNTFTTPSLSSTTTYSAWCKSTSNCYNVAGIPVTATINAIPAVAPTSSASSFCLGQTATLNSNPSGGTAPYTYAWSGGFAIPSPQNVSFVFGTTSAGTYVVTLTDNKGCTATGNVTVTANPEVTATATGDTKCVGGTITLSATGGTSYAWTGPNSFTSNIANPSIPTATLAMAGVYTVTVSNAAGCAKTATANVVINALPTAPTITNGSRCGTGTVSLSASCATGTVEWYVAAGTGAALGAGNTFTTPSLTTTTTYSAWCKSTSNCYNVAGIPVTATINAIPVVAPTSSASSFCLGQTATLNSNPSGGTAPYTYAWTGGFAIPSPQNVSFVFGTTSAGTYAVTLTDNKGCTATGNVTVTANPEVTATATGDTKCVGGTISLSATGGTIYSWVGPSSFTSNIANPTIATATLGMVGVYTVTVSNATGCAKTATANVVINALPTTSNAGTDKVNCNNSNFTMTANVPTVGTGAWSLVSGTATITTSTSATTTITGLAAGSTATLRWTISNGVCTSSTDDVILTNNALPSAPTSAGASRCGPGTVNLSASGCVGGTISWYNAATGGSAFATGISFTTPSLTAPSSVSYYIECTTNSCVSVSRNIVTATVNTVPTATATANFPILGGTLNLGSTGGGTYSWTGPNSFTSTQQNVSTSPVIALMSGTYTVTVNVSGCTATATTSVFIAGDNTPGEIDCSLIPTLSFVNPTKISGIDGADGTTYRFSNITTGTDAILTIVSRTHADISISNLDIPAATYGGFDAAFQPIIDYNWINGGGLFDAAGEKSVTFKIDFVNAGTTTPKIIPNLVASGIDIDGSGLEVREFIETTANQSHQLESPTSITMSGVSKAIGSYTTFNGINELALDAIASFGFSGKSSVTFTIGAEWNGNSTDFGDNVNPTLSDETRLNSLYFKCINLDNNYCDLVLAPPVTTPTSRCGTGTVTLSANGCTGIYTWFNAATGGTSIGTGSSLVIASISTTTTYYVECDAVGCTSVRASVVATINAIPAAPTVTGGNNCGTGTVTLSATGCTGGTIAWFNSATGGTSLTTGTNFSITALVNSTVYFASCTSSNNCVSAARNYGVATINPIPQAQLSTINPTCLGMQSVSNGKLVLTKFEGIDQFSYNIGPTYNVGTATGFAVIPSNGEVLTGIADPGTSITYTVRIRNIENCTVDKTVTINKQCGICPVSFCEPPSNITKTK